MSAPMHPSGRLSDSQGPAHGLVAVVVMFFAWLSASAALADQASLEESSRTPNYVETVNPFRRNYLSLELTRNYPLSFSQNRFDPGPIHPMIGYRYDVDAHWLMGVGAQFKSFRRRPDDLDSQGHSISRELVLWSVYHEMYYAMRLEHPFYLMVGPRVLYMLPSKAGKLPLLRDDTQRNEIGVSLSLMMARLFPGGGMLTIRIDRWRGTTTQRLHGLESAVGWSFPLQ